MQSILLNELKENKEVKKMVLVMLLVLQLMADFFYFFRRCVTGYGFHNARAIGELIVANTTMRSLFFYRIDPILVHVFNAVAVTKTLRSFEIQYANIILYASFSLFASQLCQAW